MMGGGEPVPETRPPSPFLTLLLGAAVTSLLTEWMRFQFGAALGFPVAAFGTAATFRATVGTYRARVAWRTEEHVRPVVASAGVRDVPGQRALRTTGVTVRTLAPRPTSAPASGLALGDSRLGASPRVVQPTHEGTPDILADPGRRR